MKIGLVIAIARELQAFLESHYKKEIIEDRNFELFHFEVNGNDVYACKSGFGMIDSAAVTQMLISKYNCDIILNYGVTGALKENLNVDDLFVVTSAVNHAYDVSPSDPVKKHQYEEFEDIYIPLEEELIRLAMKIKPDLKYAVCATGDNFVVDKDEKLYLRSLGCDICDMEIAAIARVCYINSVKCFCVKCISDTFDGDGHDFNLNVTRSAKVAFNFIEEMLKAL